MNDVTIPRDGGVTQFDPSKAREITAQADAVIEYAKSVKDWPALELAVDKKIEEQIEFVRWWRQKVTRGRPKKKNADLNSFLSLADAEDLTGISQVQVARWAKRLKDVPKYREQLYGAAYKAAMAAVSAPHVTHNSGENEWYTPPEIIEAARRVMGGIDLDPATSVFANRTVGAEVIYTAKEDGLKREWHGRVWMNPPYAQPLCSQFCEAAALKAESGEIDQACVLVNNATETAWFQSLLAVASAVCFLKGRVKFIDPDGQPSGCPLQGQAVLYLGPNHEAFVTEFRRIGKASRWLNAA